MKISNERRINAMLNAALRDVNEKLSETLRCIINMHVQEIEKYVALICTETLTHNERIIDAGNRFNMFPKSGLVRQHTAMVRLINRLELINKRFENDKVGKSLLKVVEINLPHIKEGEQKIAELIKSKEVANE